jgi:CRP/FNR family transcriptional regulator, cyclic AMP receptor protein
VYLCRAMSTTADVLAEVPMFQLLDDNERVILAERVDVVPLDEGKVLFQYGDPGDWMVIIKSGRVELSVKTKTGDKLFLEIAEAGDFFGEISLLDPGPRTATATVLEAGEAIIVDRGDLQELLQLKPQAAQSLLTATGKRLRHSQQILRNTAARNLNEVPRVKGNLIMRAADAVAGFSGSLTFLVLHIFLFSIWIICNVGVLPFGGFDTYPFSLLTMVVSLEAIMLSTLLLFSSNREADRERVRSDIEYEVNLKAELQIQHLHEKVDNIHSEMLRRLDALIVIKDTKPHVGHSTSLL